MQTIKKFSQKQTNKKKNTWKDTRSGYEYRWKSGVQANYLNKLLMLISHFSLFCCSCTKPCPTPTTDFIMASLWWRAKWAQCPVIQPWAGHSRWWFTGSPLLLGTQQQDPCLCGLFKQILFTGYSNRFSSLPLSISSVSKYHLLHLNLIRMFLGIHYPYLFLVSPYQRMPAYLYQDPDKICTTPVILESSPTLAEQESNVTWYTNFTFYTTAKNCHAGWRIA